MIRIAVNESEQRREPPFQSETPASITESRQNGNTFNYNEPIPPLGIRNQQRESEGISNPDCHETTLEKKNGIPLSRRMPRLFNR